MAPPEDRRTMSPAPNHARAAGLRNPPLHTCEPYVSVWSCDAYETSFIVAIGGGPRWMHQLYEPHCQPPAPKRHRALYRRGRVEYRRTVDPTREPASICSCGDRGLSHAPDHAYHQSLGSPRADRQEYLTNPLPI